MVKIVSNSTPNVPSAGLYHELKSGPVMLAKSYAIVTEKVVVVVEISREGACFYLTTSGVYISI